MSGTQSAERPRTGRFAAGRSRRILLIVVCAGWGVGLLALAWIAVTAMLVQREVKELRSGLAAMRSQVEAGDLESARATAASLSEHAERAHRLTTGPAWATAAAVPYLGEPLATVRGAAKAVDGMADDGLPGVIDAAEHLDLDTIRTADGGIDADAVLAAAPAIAAAHDATTEALRSVGSLAESTWLSSADRARATLVDELTEVSSLLETADRAARLAPTLLGSQGLQRYFIGFQNDAEARGTGGLPGAFAVVEVDHGRIQFTAFESDEYLRYTPTDVDLGPQFAAAYGYMNPTSLYVNTNVSPHFPYAAQIWAAMWQARTGQQITGAIAIDPTALSYLLAATGPAPLPDGTTISAANVVEITQSTAYSRFDDQDERKQFLVDTARAVSEHLLDPAVDTSSLLERAGRAAQERRLLVWSADPAMQAELEQTSLSGAVPDSPDPYGGFVINNSGGNKLDYYLDRAMQWTAEGCGPQRTVTATIVLTNQAPTTGLPGYVNGRLDDPDYPVNPGDNSALVSYVATQGAELLGATLDGQPIQLSFHRERDHPAWRAGIELPVGQPRTLTLTLSEPDTGAPLELLSQPLVRPMTVDVREPDCAA